MENNYFDNSPEKTAGFYVALFFIVFFLLFSIGIDLTEYIQHQKINIPSWFSYLILGIDVLAITAVVAIFFYKKWGVYLYPVLITMHLCLHEFYLSTLLYADLFNLFVFIGVGLLAVIPKWKFFN